MNRENQTDIDPLDLRAQQEAKVQRDEADQLMRLTEAGDLKWLMAHKQGRRIAWGLLSKYGLYRLSFSSDPLVMAFHEGSRNHGIALITMLIEHCPERYAEMIKEHSKHGR